MAKFNQYAPGARVIIRDEEWLVNRVDKTSDKGAALTVTGLSLLVHGKERIFLTDLEKIEPIDPLKTTFVNDDSYHYRKSRLYLESLLRQTPPTDSRLYVGNKAAIDLIPFQLDPAIQTLEALRPRVLIADSVGLGKTIECGILLSELIERGKGKRILVLAVKSMLVQFQKELWTRFTIPLVRLDSIGIQRVRNRIPSNHNPFYYYDKVIISIDTLKQESEYRNYLEQSHWDIIVIDEAHNVAERGTNSQRSKLAKLLAGHSDALIMLSATPHDGRPKSFASLMKMLDPTTIPNVESYTKEDIKGLFIRRFKKDIKDQIQEAIPERKIFSERAQATDKEEIVFDHLNKMKFERINTRNKGSILFKTTLIKALFSSPMACRETISNRIKRLKSDNKEKDHDPKIDSDIKKLEQLDAQLAAISKEEFSKYQLLLKMLKPKTGKMKWNPSKKDDRIVIFTERIKTMKFLEENLKKDLGLSDKQVTTLDGGRPDIEIMEKVEEFGKESSKVRLLICSDVMSEGINLHYFCHRLIHFDIPWSLMIFQQRNGRIDRYGQQNRPEIYYLQTESTNEKVRGDNQILNLLKQKDEEVINNLGDPSTFTHCYDPEEEINRIGLAIEAGETAEDLSKKLQESDDPLSVLFGEIDSPKGETVQDKMGETPTLFSNDFDYVKEALIYLNDVNEKVQYDCDSSQHQISITPSKQMENRLKFLPPEVLSESLQFHLDDRVDEIKKAFTRCRESENDWPEIQYLWRQHPVVEFINDKVITSFERLQAPVLFLGNRLPKNEMIYLVSGVIPNRQSQPVIFLWNGLHYRDGKFIGEIPIMDCIQRFQLNSDEIPNQNVSFNEEDFQKHLPNVIEQMTAKMMKERDKWEKEYNPKLNDQLTRLEELKKRHESHLQQEFDFMKNARLETKKNEEMRHLNNTFTEFLRWVEDSMTTEKSAYIRVAALLKGGN